MLLALDWRVALAAIVLLVVVTLVTDYIALGTVTTVIVSPIGLGIFAGGLIPALIVCAATAVMLFKHRDNYERIRKGTEIGLRSASKGKHRV